MKGKAEAPASAFLLVSKFWKQDCNPFIVLTPQIPIFKPWQNINKAIMLRLNSLFIATFLFLATGTQRVEAGEIEFVENSGQWPEQVLFRVDLNVGSFYLEKGGFMYSLVDMKAFRRGHDHHEPLPETVQAHAFRMTFVNARLNHESQGFEKSPHYRNYLIGNDRTKWASHVHSYQSVTYSSLYEGIDLKVYQYESHLKYDVIVAPNADPGLLQMYYEGMDGIQVLKNGDLELKTSVCSVFEKKPVAFQIIEGKRIEIPCEYVLDENLVTFRFPEGYNQSQELVIDPELVFASYSGSTADNFGSSATYDASGNLYGAGTSFGTGYPVTTGAYTQTAAGNTDIGISKFSSDGANLIYSTFIGGSAAESVNSLIVNENDELYLFGTSSSLDYPTSTNAFQTVNNQGPPVNWAISPVIGAPLGYGIQHVSGCDIVITRLSADGSDLLSSTFVGGTHNDGLNPNTILSYNFGDPFRGEINLDDNGSVYVASSSESADFPTTGGAFQPTIGGSRDGVVFKMNPDLSNMIWSSFIGGSSTDNAYSIQLFANGEAIVGGGTLSSDFPTTQGTLNSSALGQADGWVARFSPNGSAVLASTLIGTDKHDQVYFVQIDPDGNVFVLGQSLGTVPIFPSTVYSNSNSAQFIQKLDGNLSNLMVSTTIGTGSGVVDFSPTAFLVSNCYQIFLSGWGGESNHILGNATQSSTTGLPVTPDAFQANTDGSDFYLMMLDQDAEGLVYGTFFGGSSNEHVDGGTSRFDKNGNVYQAVCAGCGNSNDFPTTPGAWSNTNNSQNCNLGVFKFNLNQIISVPEFNILLQNCDYPLEVEFFNNSTGANTFLWDFGDNETSTDFQGSHFYADPGHYEITLYASDSAGCLVPDTGYAEFDIPVPPEVEAFGSDTICALDTVPLNVVGVGIANYVWSPSNTLDNDSSTTVNAIPIETTDYIILATDSLGCTIADTVTVFVAAPPSSEAGENAYLQPGVAGELFADVAAGSTVEWSPPDGLSCTDCISTIANPLETTTYYLTVTDELGCMSSDSVIVYAYPTIYVPNAFTPGGNVKNPIFYAYGLGIADFTMTIYSRWGQILFQSDDIYEGWDGTVNGTEAQRGVYVWTIQYTTDIDPTDVKKMIGHVSLLRNVY